MTNDTLKYLIAKKVPITKNMITDKWLPIKISKKGKFFYANGRRICKNMVAPIMKVGA